MAKVKFLDQQSAASAGKARFIAEPTQTPLGRPKQTLAAHGGRKGSFLPLSTDPEGNLQFDPTAGVLGMIGSAATLPGDVVTGKTNVHSPEASRRTTELAMLATPIGAAVRAGEKAIPGVVRAVRPTKPKTPTAEELKAAGAAGFEKARATEVDYSSSAVKAMADDIQRALETDGILAELTPKTFGVLRKLQDPPDGSVASLDGLVAARRALQHAAGDLHNPTEKLAATVAIRKLDEFLAGGGAGAANLQPGVVAGPAADAARVLEEARGNYAAAKRSEKLTGAEERAELNAAAANSGLNTGNQIRQRLRDILVRPKDARGYSKEELALIKDVVAGKFGSELARYAGNLLGGGGGLGQTLTTAAGAGLGALAGGPGGAAVGAAALPIAGATSRHLYNTMVKRQVGKLDEMIRQRSPLYEQLVKTAPLAATSPKARDAFLRTLMLIFGDAQEAKPQAAPTTAPGLLGPPGF